MFFFLEQSGFIRNYRMGALSLQRLNNDQLLLLIYSIFLYETRLYHGNATLENPVQ